MGLDLDSAGNVYVAGVTKSTDFPVLNAFQPSHAADTGNDLFITKYTPSGSKMYATYLGGSGTDSLADVAVDAAGAVYLTGSTSSTDFPMKNPAQGTCPSGGGVQTIITKLDPSGTALDYSTYWGGSGVTNGGYAITIDGSGDAYVAGTTNSANFPVINGTTASAGGFVAKFAPGGTALYSTVISGGGGSPIFSGIAVNDQGDAVVGGWCGGTQYPVVGSAYQTTNRASNSYTGILSILTDAPAAPTTAFSVNVTNGTAPLSVAFTDASTGDAITARAWDFQDDGTVDSTETNPTFTYAATGNYTVNLTVTNAGGSDSETKTGYITVAEPPVNPPVVNFAGEPRVGSAPLRVNFTDQSTGNPTEWAWDFQNDGTIDSTEQNPNYTYTTPGIYQVNLTAKNAGGSAFRLKGNYINVTGLDPNLPGTDFTSDTRSGPAPLRVTFTDTTSGSPFAWAWDFQNDGVVDSTEQNPSYTYTAPGIYQVNLTATNAAGSRSRLKANYINVTAPTVAPESGVLSAPRHIFVAPANGAKYDLDGAAFGGPSGTYYIKADGGGLNELHVTNSAAVPFGQVTSTNATAGTFWVTNTGGRGFDDDIVLLVSVQGDLPDDFGVRIKSSGYTWTPGSVVNAQPTGVQYTAGAVDDTFTKADFAYGPQTWKPGPGDLVTPSLPFWTGQNIADPSTASRLLFVDLKVGNLYPAKSTAWSSLTDAGGAKVEFSFTNMTSVAAFNAYGWCLAANQGQGISWTNRVEGTGNSGYKVVYEPPAGPTVVQVPTGTGLPTDTDGDGLYDDVNGNGRADFNDVVLYFTQMEWIAANEPLALFDYNMNGRIDFADVVWLFNLL